MNVVSFTEDIFERFIEEASQLRNELRASADHRDKTEDRLKAYEAACTQLIAKLEHAREIAADPSLVTPQRVAWLHIENHNLKREVERLEKEVTRLHDKFAEHRAENEKKLRIQTARGIQTARAAASDKENRSQRQQLKDKAAAIERFARTHRAERPAKKRRPLRRKRIR